MLLLRLRQEAYSFAACHCYTHPMSMSVSHYNLGVVLKTCSEGLFGVAWVSKTNQYQREAGRQEGRQEGKRGGREGRKDGRWKERRKEGGRQGGKEAEGGEKKAGKEGKAGKAQWGETGKKCEEQNEGRNPASSLAHVGAICNLVTLDCKCPCVKTRVKRT